MDGFRKNGFQTPSLMLYHVNCKPSLQFIWWVLQSESQCACEFQCNYHIHWLLCVWWVLVIPTGLGGFQWARQVLAVLVWWTHGDGGYGGCQWVCRNVCKSRPGTATQALCSVHTGTQAPVQCVQYLALPPRHSALCTLALPPRHSATLYSVHCAMCYPGTHWFHCSQCSQCNALGAHLKTHSGEKPPRHPLICTALHLNLLYFTSMQFLHFEALFTL